MTKGMEMTSITTTNTKTFKTLAGAFLISAAFAPVAMAGSGQHMAMPGYTPDLLPANPSAGMCYARVEIPAQYTTRSERVALKDGYQDMSIEQAQLASRQEQVEIKEASVRYEVRQPTFRSVQEQVMTRPAYDKLSVTPPKFVTKTVTIAGSAPRLVWKRGNPGKLIAQGYKVHSTADAGQGGRGYSSTTQYGATGGQNCGDTCEIWCLVEEPGEHVEYNRQVIMVPAKVQRQQVPAKYRTIMKQVVSDPGGVREIPVPAQYQTITVEDVVRPADVRTSMVPTQYGEVAKKVLVSPERYEWRQVVCKPGTATSSYSAPSTTRSSYSAPSSYTSSSYTAPAYTAPVSSSSYSSSASYGSTYSTTTAASSGTLYSSDAYGELVPTYNNGVTSGAISKVAPSAMQMGATTCSGTSCNPYEGRKRQRHKH